MVAASRLKKKALSQASGSKSLAGPGRVRTIGACAILLASSVSAIASPLSVTTFNNLASECAAEAEIPTLRAVASIESHFDPLMIRDNTTHESWTSMSATSAAGLTKQRLIKGHSIDIGLMQINSANLASLGMTVNDAFDACHSLAAAQRILLTAFAAGSNEIERQAAILISLSRYNTGQPLRGVVNGYADKVMTAQAALLNPENVQQHLPIKRTEWNVWSASGVPQTSWIFIAGQSTEIERAGAQTSDARNEGRAPGTPSVKGEPYELFAYRESEASKR